MRYEPSLHFCPMSRAVSEIPKTAGVSIVHSSGTETANIKADNDQRCHHRNPMNPHHANIATTNPAAPSTTPILHTFPLPPLAAPKLGLPSPSTPPLTTLFLKSPL